MKEEKLYMVTVDTYMDDPYGSEISFLGLFSSREKAEEFIEENSKKTGYTSYTVNEVKVDNSCDIYLGGYVE